MASRQDARPRKRPRAASNPPVRRIVPRVPKPRPRELKGMDTNVATVVTTILSTTSTNGDIATINLVEPGTGSFNRIGRKIYPQSLRVKGLLFSTSVSNAENANWVRMVVVHDKQPSGVLPTFNTIFGDTEFDGTETSTITSNLKYDNTDRFRVLRDKHYILQYTVPGSSGAFECVAYIDEFINLKGIETVYSAQTSPTTIADISSGSIYVIFRAWDGTNNAAQLANCTARLRYYD